MAARAIARTSVRGRSSRLARLEICFRARRNRAGWSGICAMGHDPSGKDRSFPRLLPRLLFLRLLHPPRELTQSASPSGAFLGNASPNRRGDSTCTCFFLRKIHCATVRVKAPSPLLQLRPKPRTKQKQEFSRRHRSLHCWFPRHLFPHQRLATPHRREWLMATAQARTYGLLSAILREVWAQGTPPRLRSCYGKRWANRIRRQPSCYQGFTRAVTVLPRTAIRRDFCC